MTTPRIGIHLVAPPARVPAIAGRAEEAGCDSVWVSDHVIWPATEVSGYPYSVDGQPPVDGTTPFHDPWVLLAAVATATTSIRLGSCVYVLPLRPLLVTARAVATLDTVSGGRALLGCGVGWLRPEFEAMGEDFDSRVHRTEEIVRLLRRLWSEPVVSSDGGPVPLPPVHFEPKPPQGRHLPIQFGGESDAALRRAAHLGDGWIGMPHDVASAADRVATLRRLREDGPRAGLPFEITVNATWPLTADELAAYGAAGVDRIIVRPWQRSRDWEPGIDAVARLLAA